VTLFANEKTIEQEDGTHYLYDVYSTVTLNRPSLGQYISGNLDEWIAAYEEAEIEEVAAAARRARDRLLAESDKTMVLDRMGLNIPENITATTLLPAAQGLFRALRAACSGEWAAYRQALRDIPEQAGFPYEIDWPKKPEI
jgi:hypothetical protein